MACEPRLNILGVLRNPSASDLERVVLPDFGFVGFDLLDIHGDVSALTNCGVASDPPLSISHGISR